MIPQPTRSARVSKTSYGDLVPPLAGINTYDVLTALKPSDAIRLENWVCRADGLHVRAGKQLVMNEIGASVVSLFGYGKRVFSATATGIFEGRLSRVSALTNGKWSCVTVTNPAGRFLWMCNGADNPRSYNGTDWSAPTISGVDGTKFEVCAWHQRRIFASEKSTLTVWYLDTNAIAGTAQPIYLQALCQEGGSVAAIGSITGNAAKDIGDMLAIVTTKGEVVIYSGSDPGHANSWNLVGVFQAGEPVPGSSFAKVGSKLMLLTVDGLVSIPDMLAAAQKDQKPISPSRKINKLLVVDERLREADQRWSVVESGSNNLLMIHAPSELQTRQYVQASETSGWSTFEDLGATCWLEHDGNLLFGTADGKIYRYDGYDDDGAAINSFMVGSYNMYRTQQRKSFNRVKLQGSRPLGYHRPRIELLTDYKEPPATFAAAYQAERYRQWDAVDWPDMPLEWATSNGTVEGRWRGISGRGKCAALMIGLKTRAPIEFHGGQIQFETGGMI